MQFPTLQLSLAPLKISVPPIQKQDVPEPTSAVEFINKIVKESIFELLFSESEKKYIQGKFPKVDTTEKKIANLASKFSSSRQQCLEELNSIILSINDVEQVSQLFEKAKVTQQLPSWFQQQSQDQTPNEKALILNLIILCSKELSSNQNLIADIMASTISTIPALAKKHYLALTCLISNSFVDRDTQKITFTMKPALATFAESMAPNFDFLLYGGIPPAIQKEEEITKKYTLTGELTNYLETGYIKHETNNQFARLMLITLAKLIPEFVKVSTKLFSKVSRLLSSTTVIPPIFGESTPAENDRDCDITTLGIWASFFVIHQCLYTSNFFDADVFGYILDKNSISHYFIQSVTKEADDFIKSEKQFPATEALLTIAGYLCGHVYQASPSRVVANVSDKILRQISAVASEMESKSVRAAVAFFDARCMNWVPRPGSNVEQLDTTLISFVFMNLEQFELYEKYYTDEKATPELLTEQKYVPNLKEHAKVIGVDIDAI